MGKTLNQRIHEVPLDVKKAIYDSGYQDGCKETAEKIIHYINTEIRNYINDSDLPAFEEQDVKWLKKQFGI